MIRVLVVDDEQLVLRGFELILNNDPEIEVVGAGAGVDALALIREHTPDVLLLDIHMPVVDGVQVLQALAADDTLSPKPRVVMLTTFAPDDTTLACLRLGAVGFLVKDIAPDDLISCVRQVASGLTVLTDRSSQLLRGGLAHHRPTATELISVLSARERDVLALLGAGKSNAEIAKRLHLSSSTVKDHVSRILEKTGTENRTQVAVLAAQAGLDAPTGS